MILQLHYMDGIPCHETNRPRGCAGFRPYPAQKAPTRHTKNRSRLPVVPGDPGDPAIWTQVCTHRKKRLSFFFYLSYLYPDHPAHPAQWLISAALRVPGSDPLPGTPGTPKRCKIWTVETPPMPPSPAVRKKNPQRRPSSLPKNLSTWKSLSGRTRSHFLPWPATASPPGKASPTTPRSHFLPCQRRRSRRPSFTVTSFHAAKGTAP